MVILRMTQRLSAGLRDEQGDERVGKNAKMGKSVG